MSQPLLAAPSMLATSLRPLAKEMRSGGRAGNDWIRFNIRDGRVVAIHSFWPAIVQAIRFATGKPVNVHLMDIEPARSLDAYPPSDSAMSETYR